MKKISILLPVLFFISLGAACTINLPYDVMDDYDGVRVVMKVAPDDAEVLLNGRFIGAAYEFSTANSALRLATRQNELIFKKKGFAEEVIDLRSYSSRHITLNVKLEKETAAAANEPAATDEAYKAKTETPPAAPPAAEPAAGTERVLTDVLLTVTPFETAIYIDGKFWGLAPEQGKIENLRLKPGKYVFEAFKPGFSAYKKEVTVPKGEKFTLSITLQK